MPTIYTDKDTWISQYWPNDNYGGDNSYTSMSYNGAHDSLVSFNVSGISLSSISNATLYLYYYYGNGTRHHNIRRLTSDFTENTVMWNSGAPSYTTTNQVGFTSYDGDTGWHNFDITNMLKDETTSRFGINIHCTDSSSDWMDLKFRSKEYGSAYRAYIVYDITTNFYVKTSGSDSNDGTSWADADAWATVDKAATTVIDGSTVHIGFGTYNAEPANNNIAPVNAGSVGIKYLPETETTGGGTGSVIVEVN